MLRNITLPKRHHFRQSLKIPFRSNSLQRALRQLKRDYSDTQYVFVSERKAPLSTRSSESFPERSSGRTKRARFVILSLGLGDWRELKIGYIPISYVIPVVIIWQPTGMILERFKIIWDIEIFSDEQSSSYAFSMDKSKICVRYTQLNPSRFETIFG